MEPITTFSHKGCKVEIIQDNIPENPMEAWDFEPGTHFRTEGRTFIEGDPIPEREGSKEFWDANLYRVEQCSAKQTYIGQINFGTDANDDDMEIAGLELVTLQDCVNCENRCQRLSDWRNDNLDYWRSKKERIDFFETHIVLAVYKYSHSGVAYNTEGFQCPWDSGQTGYISAPNNLDVPDVKAYLKKVIKTFSDWASGNVWGFVVTCGGEEVDSCWGFYGDYDDEYLLGEAKAVAKHYFDKVWEDRKSVVKLYGGVTA